MVSICMFGRLWEVDEPLRRSTFWSYVGKLNFQLLRGSGKASYIIVARLNDMRKRT